MKNGIRKSLKQRQQKKKKISEQNNFGYMMNIKAKFVKSKEAMSK